MTNVDYATTYFKFPVPSPINGKPTNKTLKRLNTELRANRSSIDTDLGEGGHGYLGLILANQEYLRINNLYSVRSANMAWRTSHWSGRNSRWGNARKGRQQRARTHI